MAIPPEDEDVALHTALLAKLAARNGLSRVSVGMSADYETAIRFGATHVRVGTRNLRRARATRGLSACDRTAQPRLDLCCQRLSLGTVAPSGVGPVNCNAQGGTMLKACFDRLLALAARRRLGARGRRCGQRREGLQALQGLPRRSTTRRTGSARILMAWSAARPGTVEGFKYSEAMIQHGKDGLVWTEENLDKSISTNPKAFVPKNKMAFPGLKKPEERANVIAYLATAEVRLQSSRPQLLVEQLRLDRGSAALARARGPARPAPAPARSG